MDTRYDLAADEVRRITAQLLTAHPGRARFGCLVTGPDSPLAAVGRALEREVFERTFGNDSQVMAKEYGPYEDHSRFFVVLDRRRRVPAGVARMIEGTGRGVKTVDDAPALIGVPLDQILAGHGMTGGTVWDCATLAVRPEYRGRGTGLLVSSLLYRTFLVEGRRRGVRHAVSMLDRGAYRSIALLGTPLQPLAGSGPFAYLGSAENRAVYMDFPAIAPAVTAHARDLRRSARLRLDVLRRGGLGRLLTARLVATASRRVGTGHGIDHLIVADRDLRPS
ncbi:hypothetical protein [Actinoplanes sp. N902-109]|uniref:hypothetical protein n=1 Tax=Actinoplanes sp. (strain N902-109) TaxID=649831 RepID=UPI0003294491|nr:hypothetical protein [Actinoplanes sp. N902-109]AGL18369.1 hypothetical protein L083_4859 [Actinoplanes sp. N902-109]